MGLSRLGGQPGFRRRWRDAADGVSYQRVSNTGDNAADFVAAKRTAGAIEVGKAAEEKTLGYTHEEPHTTGGANVLVSEMTVDHACGKGRYARPHAQLELQRSHIRGRAK